MEQHKGKITSELKLNYPVGTSFAFCTNYNIMKNGILRYTPSSNIEENFNVSFMRCLDENY